METAGVRKRGLTAATMAGSSPPSAMAKIVRDAVRTITLRLPETETTTPAAIMAAPQVPRKCPAASASGRCDAARPGSVPIETVWIKM